MHDVINQTKCMSQQEIILVIQTLLQLLDFTWVGTGSESDVEWGAIHPCLVCCNWFFFAAWLHCLLLQIHMFKFSFCGDVEHFFAAEPSIVPLSFSFLQACSKSVLSKIDHFTPTIDFMCIMIFFWTMNLEGTVAMLLEIKLDMVFLKELLGALLLVEWIRANLGCVHHMRRIWKENLNMGRFGHFFLPAASFHACPAQPQRSLATLVLALGTSLVLVEWIRTNLGCGHHIEGIRKEDIKTGCFQTFPTCFSFCQVETSIHFATCLFLWQLSWKMSPNVSFCPSVCWNVHESSKCPKQPSSQLTELQNQIVEMSLRRKQLFCSGLTSCAAAVASWQLVWLCCWHCHFQLLCWKCPGKVCQLQLRSAKGLAAQWPEWVAVRPSHFALSERRTRFSHEKGPKLWTKHRTVISYWFSKGCWDWQEPSQLRYRYTEKENTIFRPTPNSDLT